MAKLSSCHEILPRLYLGDIHIATNKDEIKRLGITDMITVEIKSLSQGDLAPTIKRYLHLHVMDHPKHDIISHFSKSYEFIETALRTSSNKVYVHCVAGISRSATLVIAYIMRTRSMNYQEALDLVRNQRKVVDPNEGFVRQLWLYHKMKYSIDIGNFEYRRLVLDALVFEFRLTHLSYYQAHHDDKGSSAMNHSLLGHKPNASKNDAETLFNQYYDKLGLNQVSKHPNIYTKDSSFRCSKCQALLFYTISIIENSSTSKDRSPGMMNTSSSTSLSAVNSVRSPNATKGAKKECPFLFIEPQTWMSKSILERDGHLECQECKSKLGKFDWTGSEGCSCDRHNSHLNSNLFKMIKKKVEKGAATS